MTRKGLDIVQGSAGVLIGAPTGVACSVCPGGITYANPVNPLLGAKVLPGETDLALPGPLPFILSRAYSSYRTRTPAPVGVFGPGWKAPFDIRLSGCTTSGPTTTITTASTVWCSTRGYSTANHRWRAGTSMTRWAAGRENGYGGGSVT